MTSSRSIASRFRKLAHGTFALALAFTFGSAREARAAEVAPQLSLGGGILVVTFSAPSLADEPSPGEFFCSVGSQAADGNFACSSSGVSVSGRVVGVTNNFGVVVGHLVRMERVAGTTTERFEAAVAFTGDELPHVWMAGSVERTTRTQSCSGTGTRRRCITLNQTTGPFPFTGELFSISG